MKKISKEQFLAMSVKRNGRRHAVSILVEQLQVGEYLYIPGPDWNNRRRSPNYLVERAAKDLKRKYNFYKQTDVRAWVVERVE